MSNTNVSVRIIPFQSTPISTLNMDFIFVEILPRLPAKSLVRFKCVSKSFKSTISSSNFNKLFLRYQIPSSDLLTLPGNNSISCYELADSTVTRLITTFAWDDAGSASVVGSCHGLLCILTRKTVSYLSVLNPTTRFCRHIHYPNDIGQSRGHGFAFDYENLDYKIVVVSDVPDKFPVRTRTTFVYSSNANSWRVIESTLATDFMEVERGGVLINNNLLHWMFWSPILDKHVIGCFDVCQNQWADNVLLPRCHYDPHSRNHLLDIEGFNDCLFSLFSNTVDLCFDVWAMKEHGVQDSWFRILSFPHFNGFRNQMAPLVYNKESGEFVNRKRRNSWLFWYYNMNGIMVPKEAEFDGAPDFSNLQPYKCSKSLVELPCVKLS